MTANSIRRAAIRTRTGLVLPFVLISLLVVLALSGGLQTMAWRATRGARSQWDAQRATFAADAAINRALSTWSSESLAQQPIGVAVVQTTTEPSGWQTELTLIRTGTLIAFASATTTRVSLRGTSDPLRVWRRVMTSVHLEPPRIPMLAVATILGDVELGSSAFDGRDTLLTVSTPLDDCGTLRDTSSIGAASVGGTFGTNTPNTFGLLSALRSPALQSAREQFDAAWPRLLSKATVLPVATTITLASSAPWRASVMTSASTVTLTGASSHVGLLAVDGDLDVNGSLQVDGVLVVRGALTVNGGPLIVRGSLIVRDVNARGTRLRNTNVEYAPCAVGRAMSAVATPQFAPFQVWNSP